MYTQARRSFALFVCKVDVVSEFIYYDVYMSDIDRKSIQFHVEQNDYFGTKAAVVDVIRQDANRRGYGSLNDSSSR